MRKRLPVVIVLVAIIALGYPIALLFGLPLAQRDREDLRKWEKLQISSEVPQSLEFEIIETSNVPAGFKAIRLPFSQNNASSVLVKDGAALDWDYDSQTGIALVPENELNTLVSGVRSLERVSDVVFRLEPPNPSPTLYLNNTLLKEGSLPALEVADGQRTTFTFPTNINSGNILLDSQHLIAGQDYELSKADNVETSALPI